MVIVKFCPTGCVYLLSYCSEMLRILKPGGTCGITTWSYYGWLPQMREALATLPEPCPPFPTDEAMLGLFPTGAWHKKEFVEGQLSSYGFTDIDVRDEPISISSYIPEIYESFNFIVLPLIMNKFWSEADKERCGKLAEPAIIKYFAEKYGKDVLIEQHYSAIVATARKSR
jgi:SAM-dependent methyltransferase